MILTYDFDFDIGFGYSDAFDENKESVERERVFLRADIALTFPKI